MACISDDEHAVNSATVCSVAKAESLQPPPFESFWYLSVQTTGGEQSLRFTSVDARDKFYKKLIAAIG